MKCSKLKSREYKCFPVNFMANYHVQINILFSVVRRKSLSYDQLIGQFKNNQECFFWGPHHISKQSGQLLNGWMDCQTDWWTDELTSITKHQLQFWKDKGLIAWDPVMLGHCHVGLPPTSLGKGVWCQGLICGYKNLLLEHLLSFGEAAGTSSGGGSIPNTAHIVGLTATHSHSSGTKLLDRA